jgi:hypothetical protein
MSRVSFDAFERPDPIHFETREKVYAAMSSGHFGVARDLIADYSAQYGDKAEALRLALVRDFGTGL